MKKPVNNHVHIQEDMILIRAAKPDPKEGLVYARYLNEASEGFFEKILGPKTGEIISAAFVKPNNEFSFENATMIEFQGRIVGMASGYTAAEKEGFRRNILSESSLGSGFNIRMFSAIGKFLARYMGPREMQEYYLEAIAVSSEIRGKGLGQRLLRHTVDVATGKGAKILALDVSSKNERAIKSYRKFGMKTASIWPNFLKLPSVFTRMVMEL